MITGEYDLKNGLLAGDNPPTIHFSGFLPLRMWIRTESIDEVKSSQNDGSRGSNADQERPGRR